MAETRDTSSSDDITRVDDGDKGRPRGHTTSTPSKAEERLHSNPNATLENPLAYISQNELRGKGRAYVIKHFLGDEEDVRAFEIGALLAQNPTGWEKITDLTEEERAVLAKEQSSRWAQPRLMYLVIVLCSTCAAVQGMDETVVNGGQVFYDPQFGLDPNNSQHDSWIAGLVNSAPYLCCAFIGCWLTVPFNNVFGRRGTVFITCLFSAIACFWQGFANAWWSMFVARMALGLGIGPKSATVPIYAAETTPPAIRGALVMQWQMWTAFGIMMGYVADLALYHVPDTAGVTGLNWRLMMGSAMLPAVIVCCFVFLCPESPRWYMSKGRHFKAYESMCKLRFIKVQAARDIFYMYTLLEAESAIVIQGRFKILELVRVPRNRRALLASEIVMFMQQFCGVNVIAYYSSGIFIEAGFSTIKALAASLGFGILNFLFAIPAIYTIDTFGRRNLLLFTFPFMAIFLFFVAFSFYIPDLNARIGCITLGVYIYTMFYSPGMGPVPFTYSAEAYPLYVRGLGMSLATATLWFFNFVLSITWPSLKNAFTPTGAFGWYAGWNVIGFFLVLAFLPETKAKTLEELDQVFAVPTHKHMAWGLRQVPWWVKRHVLRRKIEPEVLYHVEEPSGFEGNGEGEKGVVR